MPSSLRYVVLHHTGVAEPHFDVMVETVPGGPLRTWRVATWPIVEPTVVTPLADHRAVYLDYEGPVSGGRGEVRGVARGECAIRTAENGDCVVTLDGARSIRFSSASARPTNVTRGDAPV